MKSKRKRFLALGLLLFALQGCGGGDSSSSGNNSGPPPITTLTWDNGNWDSVNWN